jgi:hypothetical protein
VAFGSFAANRAWCELYHEVDISVEVAISFDHSLLVVVMHGRDDT